MSQYFGKYRGKVMNNVDPQQQGRIQVSVPAIFGNVPLNWAMPCSPYAGMQNAFFAIPPLQANVWVEFEGGDSGKPIWSGCFWGTGEVPALALATPTTVPHFLLQTTAQTTLLLSDAPGPTGGIMLKTSSGAAILINDAGITITNGKGATILMTNKQVLINETALVIT
ncbi:MAG TPA: phage baseplate assembly protein V [Pyrinomonadaceae bacterium]|nr:phage baseplate assembly protein V [Pyrinomonadaceae bacterium]